MFIEDLKRPPRVGEGYELDCIVIEPDRQAGDEREARPIYLPIMGRPHDDHEYGVPWWHYHLDQRFMSDAMLAEYGIIYVLTAEMPPPVIERHVCRCYRENFLYTPRLDNLGRNYAGKRAIWDKDRGAWRCPHKGMYLGNLTVSRG